MPVGRQTGQSSSNPKRREDVTEKVREIKQRQQNWLVQRDQLKNKESSDSKNKSSPLHLNKPTTSARYSTKTTKTSSYQPTIQSNKTTKIDSGKKNVTDTFNNWRKAREQHNLSDEDHDTHSIRSGAESELERLVSPDLDISREPIAEEEFGSLADKIASRVKQNMGMSESYATSHSNLEHTSITDMVSEESCLEPARCGTYTQDAPAFYHVDNSSLSSHSCSLCKKMMFSPDHIPMMIIPCGHTLCKACSEGQILCPECNCTVASLTVNIMLQQVIQEYHSHNQLASSSSMLKSAHRAGSGKVKSNQSVSSGHGDYVEDNRRNRTASYKSQLMTLHTRQNVLSEEHANLLEKLNKLTKQMEHTSSQTKSISEQEHEVKKAIVDLKDRVSALETHRRQYESQLTELQDERSEIEGKVTLLSGTLSSLTREVEKVKLLAEGEKSFE